MEVLTASFEEALFTQGFFVHEQFSLATPIDADYVALRCAWSRATVVG